MPSYTETQRRAKPGTIRCSVSLRFYGSREGVQCAEEEHSVQSSILCRGYAFRLMLSHTQVHPVLLHFNC